jgi:hypothetical protein
MTIDNGNHPVLSDNHATLAFLATIGAADRLAGPETAAVDFADLATGQPWILGPNDGRIPWWVFDPKRRVPGTRPLDYLPRRGCLAPRRRNASTRWWPASLAPLQAVHLRRLHDFKGHR